MLDEEKHIGVLLTEGDMMQPEGWVSAFVFCNPEARCFNRSPEDPERLEREFDRTAAEPSAAIGS